MGLATRHGPTPAHAITNPPISGPTSMLIWKERFVSARPALRRSPLRSRGTKVLEAGAPTAFSPDWMAITTKTGTTEAVPEMTTAASIVEASSCPTRITITSLRRSTESAIRPPSNANTSIGTACAPPIAPTSAALPVRSQTRKSTANEASCEPKTERVVPTHSRRNAGLSRSGLTSSSAEARLIAGRSCVGCRSPV